MSGTRRKLAYAVATSGGAGYAPAWPGTAGGAVGAVLAIALSHAGPWPTALMLALLFAAGTWASGQVCGHAGADDPQIIVVDETFGAAATLAVLPPEPLWWIAGFVAFRVFDIAKPWPIHVVQDRIKGGFGVMADDAAAAVFAAAVLLGVGWVLGSVL
jgi:phosphatidylglycerophosphatase A